MVVIAVVCLVMVCQVKSCAGRVTALSRKVSGVTGVINSLLPPAGQTEPGQPSIVPPGHSALPSASRRPVFGVPSDEGTEVEVEEGGEVKVKVKVEPNGRVTNLGGETLDIRVTRVGPAWVEWDPAVGVCAFVSADRTEFWPVARRGGYCLDVGGKFKAIDIRPLRGLQIGVPTLYATTGVLGVGADVKITGMEWASLDVGYFPFVKRMAVGISLNIP